MKPQTPVIALVVLAAPTVAQSKPMAGSTAAQIELLGTALESLHAETGAYPSTADGLPALREAPQDMPGWRGPYLRKDIPQDAWGRSYVYLQPGELGSGAYDLYSTGANGIDERGAGDDITSWSGVPPGLYPPTQCVVNAPSWVTSPHSRRSAVCCSRLRWRSALCGVC